MNERIQELSVEAWRFTSNQVAYLNRIHNRSYSQDEVTDIFEQKFAELIVKECLDQCYNRGMNDELYAGQLKAAAYIEEHFGVE
jgi:hypothetical protein